MSKRYSQPSATAKHQDQRVEQVIRVKSVWLVFLPLTDPFLHEPKARVNARSLATDPVGVSLL
ncbi:hypothetical protein NXC24_PB00246 (plasmid) [Rhizobium sp. NXC24]|nr:hypothetical protein NXC24_PB00246 [Rhizobium sp. NXC24]